MPPKAIRMTFRDAIKKLGIEDYGNRIFHSNSNGELTHLTDYIEMAKNMNGSVRWFRPIFLLCVDYAEKNWRRPESCFQHMPRLMREMAQAINSHAPNP